MGCRWWWFGGKGGCGALADVAHRGGAKRTHSPPQASLPSSPRPLSDTPPAPPTDCSLEVAPHARKRRLGARHNGDLVAVDLEARRRAGDDERAALGERVDLLAARLWMCRQTGRVCAHGRGSELMFRNEWVCDERCGACSRAEHRTPSHARAARVAPRGAQTPAAVVLYAPQSAARPRW